MASDLDEKMPRGQPLPSPGQASVTRSLMALLEARERQGIRTYGRSLETFNGRNPVRDALEECLDMAQYLHQWELEREALLLQVKELSREVARLRQRLAEGVLEGTPDA